MAEAPHSLARRFRSLPRARVDGRIYPVATTRRSRLLGLALLSPPSAGPGLLIPGCRSVHTFGMRFALDIRFLDHRGTVISIRTAVSPCRIVSEPGAASVLEVPAPRGYRGKSVLISCPSAAASVSGGVEVFGAASGTMKPGIVENVLDAALDGVISVDADGHIIEFNAAAEEMFGVSRDEAMGTAVMGRFVAEHDRELLWARFRAAVDGDDMSLLGRRIEITAVRDDGEEFLIELTITRTGEDSPLFTGWFREIGEQRAREADEKRRNALVQRAEQLGGLGSWEWRTGTGEVVWSDNLFRIYGYEPGEIVPTVELAVEATHPDDRERIARGVALMQRRGNSPPVDYRIVRPDGAVHDVRGTMALSETAEDGSFVILGSVQDLTEQRRFEREINAHLTVSDVLAGWEDFEGGADRLLQGLGEALSFDVGALWLPQDDALANRAFWQADSLELEEFETLTVGLRISRGDGPLGEAWRTLEPAILPNLREVEGHKRREAAEAVGLRGGIVIPARDGDELMSLIELYSRNEVVASDRLLRSLAGIGNEIGHFLTRHRGEFAPIRLTRRELEVLQLAAKGHAGKRIAERLVISQATVKTHFEHIYEKLGVRDRASAVAEALRLGLID